jgi:hypothetical protein
MNGFGPQLMLDGYGCDQRRLQDLNLIYRILDELPARMVRARRGRVSRPATLRHA